MDKTDDKAAPRRRWRVRWDRVLLLLFCLIFWAFFGWLIGTIL